MRRLVIVFPVLLGGAPVRLCSFIMVIGCLFVTVARHRRLLFAIQFLVRANSRMKVPFLESYGEVRTTRAPELKSRRSVP